jgi:tetrahedral aminopeptidase
MDWLKTLSELPGAPGREERVREAIRERVGAGVDSAEVDALGNLVCLRRATQQGGAAARRVMLSCHMDEIGFYVRHVDDEGFLRLNALGGFDPRNLYARQVRVQGREDVFGVMNPSGPPIHVASEEDKKKIPKPNDFFVDTGLPKERVQELVRVGDPVTLVQPFRTIGKLATGKNMDNRAACWVGTRVLERLEASHYDLYVAFTVQEEVGLRGARTCAYHVEPDIGIAIDVTLAVDIPGSKKEEAISRLGEGVAIKVNDGASISDRRLVDRMIALAEENGIRYQLEILPFGGTDAGGIQQSRGGVRVITLSVPCRYVHTVTESIHQDDLQSCVDLILAYLAAEPD